LWTALAPYHSWGYGDLTMDMGSLMFDRLLPVAVLCCAAASLIFFLLI
jgi:hypothetical protein